MNYYNEHTILYHRGEFVKASEAKIDLYSQSLHYGYSVFEGIRSYVTANGTTAIFKPKEHFERLAASAQALNLPYQWQAEELTAITNLLLEKNKLGDAYIRPVVYAPANMSFVQNTESYLFVQAWEMAPFLGDKLLRVMTSSFQRPNPQAFRIQAKAAGHYVNSILASQEAKAAGYDEALLLDGQGHLAEAPGANLFFEKDGQLFTPAPGHILPGITRATVIGMAKELGTEVIEGEYLPSALRQADAAFFCGTAAEIIGLHSIDEQVFPLPWEKSLGSRLQEKYRNLVRNKPTQ